MQLVDTHKLYQVFFPTSWCWGFNLYTIYFCIFICSLNFICNCETTEMSCKSNAVCLIFVLKIH